LKSELRIETPEGVVFSFTLASPVARMLAWALDSAIALAVTQIVSKAIGTLGSWSADWSAAMAAIAYFVISTGYTIALEWRWRGQTVGKRLFRLRVVDAQGLRLHFYQVALRNLLRAIDMLPLCYLVGGAAALLSDKGQRLGDLAANTIVLRESTATQPDLEQIAPSKYNSLAAYPHLAARLRSRTDPEAAVLAVRALLQRDRYEADARVALFADLAGYFREVVAYPEEAVEGLTDEQYVRSVVRVLYGASAAVRPPSVANGAGSAPRPS
jgi:uncharacterized RDD family membrane protein YckC